MNDIAALGPNTPQTLLGNSPGILGKDDFLKILVAQLQNQDPSNPMKADQFASQLAQFSSVEQLQNISSTLDSNIELDLLLNQAINNTMATTLIGKQVRASGNTVNIADGAGADLHYNLGGTAKDIKIEIRDSDGNLVRTITETDQLQGNQIYTWDGKNADGDDVPPGTYSFSVSAKDPDGKSVRADEFIFGTITGVRYQDGQAFLRVGNVEIGLADVIEILAAADTSSGSDARHARTR